MTRRDFFKALAAATAGLAVARSSVASAFVPPQKPPRGWEKEIADMLAKCVVVGIQQQRLVDGPCHWEVEYLYDPDNQWTGARLNDELKRLMPANAGMLDVTCTVESSRVSDHLFSDWGIRLTNDEPEYRVHVTWVSA